MAKKKHEDHVNHERWLVSYADFITLLFAFFVIMYAMSQADIEKLKKVSESVQKALGGASASTVDLDGKVGGSSLNQFDSIPIDQHRLVDLPTGKYHTASDPDPTLQDLREKLEESISFELGLSTASDRPELLYDSEGLVIRLAMKNFYNAGEIEIPQDLRPLVDRIGRAIAKTSLLIRIDGHTSADEVDLQKYASGWELSSARASWLAKYFINRFEMKQ